MRGSIALLSLAVVLAPACHSPNNTKIVVAVWSDIPVPTGLDSVRIDVTGPTATTSKTFSPAASSESTKHQLLVQLEVVPAGSASTSMTVTATGLLRSSAIVSQVARVSFVSGKSLLLDLFLAADCQPVTCPPNDTCAAGACQSIAVTSLPAYDPNRPPSLPDAGGAIDSNNLVDSETVEAGVGGAGDAPPPGSFANPAPGSKLFIGANFWSDEWEPGNDIFVSNVDWATTTNPWNPTLLSDLAPYAHVLRFMDWNRTNDQVDGSWATRAQPNVVAYEWQIDLCNRAHADYWVNVPTLADDDHVTKLAQLIQRTLDPGLRIYIEYSNSVWNVGLPQSAYVNNQGVAAKTPGMNQSLQGAAWYVFRAVQIFQGFEAVFGNNNPRLVKVLSGQASNIGDASNPAPLCAWHLQSLADKRVNPQGETIDAYAIAPYFVGPTTSTLAADILNVATYVQNHAACLRGTGIPLVSYEKGQDSYAASICAAVAADPAMRNLYVTYLNVMMAAGMSGPFNQYTHVGSCWGLKMATGDSNANAPKYQGVLDWVAAHP